MRKLFAILLSIGLSAVIAVGLVEVAARLDLLPCVESAPGVWEPNPQFGWFHRRSTSGWGRGCARKTLDWHAFVEMNEQGMRDDESHPYEKPAGVYRVLLLGDSFTEGFTVSLDEHFAPELERRLTAAAGRPVEVLNAGVSAWGSAQELLYYTLEGKRFSPDLVVLLFNPGNDLGENVPGLGRPEPKLAVKPSYSLRGGALRLNDFPVQNRARMPGSDDPIEDFLERRTQAFPVLRYAAAQAREAIVAAPEPLRKAGRRRTSGQRVVPAGAATAAPAAQTASVPAVPAPALASPEPTSAPAELAPAAALEPRPAQARAHPFGGMEPPAHIAFSIEALTPRWAYAWRLTKSIVREIRRQVELNGSRFVVAIVPNKTSVNAEARPRKLGGLAIEVDPVLPDTRSLDFLRSERFATCHLLPAFQAHFDATGETGFHRWDIHWSPAGHAIVAAELATCLETLGTVPRKSAS